VRTAVFGGTFDPPHLGHMVVAADVHARLAVDRVLFVPAAEPPHKRGRVHAPAETRLRMVRAAVADDDRFDVDDLELRRGGPSFTVDTLSELRRRDPVGTLFFVIGADAYREFGTWREPDEVRKLATIAVLDRRGDPGVEDAREGVVHVPVTRVDIAATEIRRRVAAGESIRYLVTEPVREIIEREGLYRRRL
jgi:nicotinate-nucleotide adenylyltransferase